MGVADTAGGAAVRHSVEEFPAKRLAKLGTFVLRAESGAPAELAAQAHALVVAFLEAEGTSANGS